MSTGNPDPNACGDLESIPEWNLMGLCIGCCKLSSVCDCEPVGVFVGSAAGAFVRAAVGAFVGAAGEFAAEN